VNVVDQIHLELFLAELSQSTVVTKDERVEALINQAFERQPDAAYLLVLRVMRLESALCAECASASWADAARSAGDPSPDEAGPRASEPWWRQPVDVLAGTRLLLQSTPYLVGGRDTRRSVDAA
jgi:hypothetical protein